MTDRKQRDATRCKSVRTPGDVCIPQCTKKKGRAWSLIHGV